MISSPLDQPLNYLQIGNNPLRFKVTQDRHSSAIIIERDDNETLSIKNTEWARGEWDVYIKIFNFLIKKVVEESQFLIGDGTSNVQKRIIEINNELDIIRGITPTPPGYVIDAKHTKDLMAELKNIVREEKYD